MAPELVFQLHAFFGGERGAEEGFKSGDELSHADLLLIYQI